MIAGGLLLLAGLMMFSTGLIGEMMMRTYFESQDRRIYAVREILTRKQRGVAGGRVKPRLSRSATRAGYVPAASGLRRGPSLPRPCLRDGTPRPSRWAG